MYVTNFGKFSNSQFLLSIFSIFSFQHYNYAYVTSFKIVSQFFDVQILISVMILISFMSSLLMSSIKTFFTLLLHMSMLFLAFLFHFSLECSFLFYVTHVMFLYSIFSIRIPNILIIIILYSHLTISTSLSYLSLLLMLNLFLQTYGFFCWLLACLVICCCCCVDSKTRRN